MVPHWPPPCTPSPLHPQAAPKAGSMIRSLPSASHYLYTESLVLAISILTDFDIPMPKNLNLVQIFLFYLLYISALIEFLFLLVRQEIFLTASPFTKSPDLGVFILYSERILTAKQVLGSFTSQTSRSVGLIFIAIAMNFLIY